MRTAQAFGTQRTLADLYDGHVVKALTSDLRAAVGHGAGLGVFFFVVYAGYALTFSFGATLILDGDADAGTVVNVFLAILIGSFSLAMMAPELQGALRKACLSPVRSLIYPPRSRRERTRRSGQALRHDRPRAVYRQRVARGPQARRGRRPHRARARHVQLPQPPERARRQGSVHLVRGG